MDCRPPRDSCRPGKGRYKSLLQMVDEYILCKRPNKNKERDYFRSLPLEGAIEIAALARNSDGKRSGHHRRRTSAQLGQGKARLIALLPKIGQCGSFDELHDVVCGMTDKVKGLGELYAYDTAYLIGLRLGLRPKRVYLHAGTREGAKALDFTGSLPYLKPSQLPTELRVLKASEMEDFLCIYEGALRKVNRSRGTEE